MKLNRALFQTILILGLTGFSACKQDFEHLEGGYDKILNRIQQLGYDIKKWEIVGEYIQIEGDILFPKNTDKFWALYDSKEAEPNARHYRNNYLVTSTQTIKVNVLSVVPNAWSNAVLQAIDEWNSLSGDLYFIGMSSDDIITDGINVTMGNGSNGDIAATTPPDRYGRPGRFIFIDNKYAYSYNGSYKKLAMVHEIGHAIGFHHTDSGMGIKINNIGYWCNNYSDSYSVMRQGIRGWQGFSSCDKKAYAALY